MDFDQIMAKYPGERYQAHLGLLLAGLKALGDFIGWEGSIVCRPWLLSVVISPQFQLTSLMKLLGQL